MAIERYTYKNQPEIFTDAELIDPEFIGLITVPVFAPPAVTPVCSWPLNTVTSLETKVRKSLAGDHP